MYILLDANVVAAYYLPRSAHSSRVRDRIEKIFNAARSGQSKFFFYLPNFCVAEVFSVFMKHAFGTWNSHLKKKGTIDKRVYKSLVKQFEADIHNGRFIYHYELSRYHVLGINLVAPIDHYYRIGRGKKRQVTPMGTFDHLIISMGIHLAHIHGKNNVRLVTADGRLSNILKKCNSKIPQKTIRKLKLDKCASLTGRPFHPNTFPLGVNLKTATDKELEKCFGNWPLQVGEVKGVYRWTRV